MSVSAEIDVDVRWKATSDPVHRGGDATGLPDPLWAAFSGEFSDAICTGRGGGAETGFKFKTRHLSSQDFYASIGYEKNGVFL